MSKAVPPPLNLKAAEVEKFTELSAVTRSILEVLQSDAPRRASDAAMASHAALERSIAFNPPPATPACGKGCSHCCRIYVSASAPEIFALARAIRSLPAPRYDALRARIRAAGAATDFDWSRDIFFTYECPLLEDNACSLYQARPDSCRGLSSYSAQACAVSVAALAEKRDEAVPKVNEHGVLRSLHTHVLWAALKGAGMPYVTYSLNQALDRVLDDDDAEGRWLAGEEVFAGVQEDTSLEGRALVMVEATLDALAGGATGALRAPPGEG